LTDFFDRATHSRPYGGGSVLLHASAVSSASPVVAHVTTDFHR
jgi:hypothetical protein